jgi:hypothetical protein
MTSSLVLYMVCNGAVYPFPRSSAWRACTNGKTDYWTYIQEAIWSMSSDDEDQQSYLKSSSLVSP